MFNFNLLNKAVSDVELSGSAFKMLYLIANKCSLENNNQVEIHNGWLMMIMNLKERQVQNLTKELVEKGYINKTIIGTSRNNKGNLYELKGADINAINDVKNYAKNCTLKNNIKINKNISKEIKENKVNNIYTSNIKEKKENVSALECKDNITSNVMSFDKVPEWIEENKEPDTSMTSTDSDDSGNNISSIEEYTDTSNVEYRNNIHSNNVNNEENDLNKNNLLNTSIEMEKGKSQNISSNNNNILTPPPRLKEDSRREISDNKLTDYLKDKLKSAKERFNQGQEEIGWIIFDDTLKYLNKHYKNLNIELINSIRNEYQDYINANKAVPDVSNGSNDKSIKEEIKNRQEANKEPKKAYNKYPCENYEEKIMKLKEKVLEKLHQEEDIEPAYNLMKEQFDKIYKDYGYSDKSNLAIMNNILNAEANKYGYGWI